MRAIVVANGSITEEEDYTDYRQPGDLVIAADGGALVALRLGLEPRVIIGDLDSLPTETRQELAEKGCQFLSHLVRKDETDTELAVRYALQAGAQEIVLLGATGDRLDHTLANVLLLGMPGLERVPATLIAGDTQVWLLRSGCELEFGGTPGDIVTLLPLGQDAVGIHTEGLEWALHNDTLRFGPARGVSNVMTAAKARVALREGMLLVLRVAQATSQEHAPDMPAETDLVTVYTAQGHMRANVIKSKLEAAGIAAMLSYDSASRVYGLTVDGIGEVRVLVRAADVDEARQLLTEEDTPEEANGA